MIFLPTVVRERSHIVEDQAAVLGVELPGGFRISSAPSRAKAVDEFAKRSVVRGLLLCPGSHERHQGPDDCQHHIQHPPPSLGISVDSSAHRCGHSVSPRNPGTRVCRGDVPTCDAYRSPFGTILQALKFGLIGIGGFWPLLPPFQPPFAGKSPLLAESLMHCYLGTPILALGQGNGPSGG